MNKTKIDWCDYTFNPVTGCLGPNNEGTTCSFCYARRIAERFRGTPAFPNGFEPTFHEERLLDPDLQRIPAGSRVFVGSMTDLGAPWAAEHLPRILEAVRARPDVAFIFLTKQPDGFRRVVWPANCWVGVTVNSVVDAWRMDLPAAFADRWFVSAEPLLGPIVSPHVSYLDWLIIGAQTGPRAVAPDPEWIRLLLHSADAWGVPVFMKDNLRRHWDGEWRQEYPRGATT